MAYTALFVWILSAGVGVCLTGCSGDDDKSDPRVEQFDQNKKKIWKRLSAYENTYLKKWRPVFQLNAEIKPVDVIDAFNVLAYQMTGPDGLWRKAVPIVWLRCDNKPESPNCLKLQEYNDTFKELDAFQEKIARTEPMRAGSFLLANMDKINEYLDMYVLATPTRAGMKGTRFYREELNASVADSK